MSPEKNNFISEQTYDNRYQSFPELKKLKILLVDDDEWIRDSLSIYFESEGFRIKACRSAEAGLKILERERFDVIITDYKLPGIDGVSFLERIRLSHPAVVKIMISAYLSESVFQQAKQAGAQQLIAKPFTVETIETCLLQLFESSKKEREA